MRKHLFDLPEGIVYLDGNSLGPIPKAARARLARAAGEWGELLIRGWNEAGWYDAPLRLGDRIAPLIGAPPGSVVVGDTLTIRIHQALSAALALAPERAVVLTCAGDFPSDLYAAQGLIEALGRGHRLEIVAPDAIEAALDRRVALLMLTEVDYRTGRLHDMKALCAKARAVGALTLFDLAHSAGALPVDVDGAGVDFAAGCTYKYLNAGPGAPAFLYVRPDRVERCAPALIGWMGHAAPFAFAPDYEPAPGIARFRVGTPPVLQMAALDAALDVFEGVDMADLRARSIALTERFRNAVAARCPDLALASPRDPLRRGSQLAFAHEDAYAVVQALIREGVIGDFRAPNLMRFGFAPLYLDADDIDRAVAALERILRDRLWDRPGLRRRATVT